jgi:hypothetical protein
MSSKAAMMIVDSRNREVEEERDSGGKSRKVIEYLNSRGGISKVAARTAHKGGA